MALNFRGIAASIIAIALIFVMGCPSGISPLAQTDESADDLESPSDTSKQEHTTAIFALGDSVTAGSQDAMTFDQTQSMSWLTQMTGQIAITADTHYSYPALNLDGNRIDPKRVPTNLAIPGLEIHEALEATGTISLFEGLPVYIPSFIAPIGTDDGENPSTTPLEALIESALKEEHADMEKWIFVWIGGNDAFFDTTEDDHITEEALNQYTPTPQQFKEQFSTILQRIRITAPAELFVLTIPNLLKSAHFFTLDDLGFFAPIIWTGDALPVKLPGPNDLIPLTVAGEIILNHKLGLPVPQFQVGFKESEIIDEKEQTLIVKRIDHYNKAIKDVADEYGATVIDIATQLDLKLQEGIVLPSGRTLTRSWSRGGLFSLDGIHPSNTGYAMIANAVIEYLNGRMQLMIPVVDLEAVYLEDPYRDMDGDGLVAGPVWDAPSGTPAALLRIFVDPDDTAN